MGGLYKKLKKYSPGAKLEQSIIGKKTFDEIHPLGAQAETALDAAEASKKALETAEAEPVIPLPDEEELERARRRRAARRGGGRAATVLSDENRVGG